MTDKLQQEFSQTPAQVTEQTNDEPKPTTIENEESLIRQPSNATVEILHSLTSWHSIGEGFKIKLPQVFSPDPIAILRVSPVIPAADASSLHQGVLLTRRPICTLLALPDGEAITRLRFDAPSLPRCYARGFRFWHGSMNVRFRVSSSNITAGLLVFSLNVFRRPFILLGEKDHTVPLDHVSPDFPRYQLGQALASYHVELDLSQQREIVIPVPPLPHFTDEHEIYRSTYEYNNGQQTGLNSAVAQLSHYIQVHSRGTLSSNNDSIPLTFLIDVQYGPDIQFKGHVGFSSADSSAD